MATNKEIKKQIKAADRVIVAEDMAGNAFHWYGWVTRPQYREIWKPSDKRKVKAAAKVTVKAFAKNPDGTFRRCAAVRAAARMALAKLIFELADESMVEMLERERKLEEERELCFYESGGYEECMAGLEVWDD